MFLKGELYNAASSLLTCNNIIIVTGFPCNLDYNPPTETDGPLGAVAIARSLVALGKKVTLLVDECNEDVMIACAAASGVRNDRLLLESFPGRGIPSESNDGTGTEGKQPEDSSFDESDMARLGKLAAKCDAVIAIERAGPSSNGLYKTMGDKDMSSILAPLDLLFDLNFIRDSKLEYAHLNQVDSEDIQDQMLRSDLETVPESESQTDGNGDVPACEMEGGIFAPMSFDYEGIIKKTMIDMEKEGTLQEFHSKTASVTNADNRASDMSMPVRIGIGDGGNEVGMGKIYNEIVNCDAIKHASEIACVTSCDHLIVCGVSNWGGYGLSTAIAILASASCTNIPDEANSSASTDRTIYPLYPQYIRDHETNVFNEVDEEPEMDTYEYRVLRVRKLEAEKRKKEADAQLKNDKSTNNSNGAEMYISTCVPSDVQERYICQAIVSSGARDGILKCNDLYVDGFPLETSIAILNCIRACGSNDEQQLIDSIFNI